MNSSDMNSGHSSEFEKGWASEFWNSADRLMLAPMEGVVDAVMRKMLTDLGGIDLCVTEFIRVTDRALPESEFRKYHPELFDGSGGRTTAGVPVLTQLLGGQPGPMGENAHYAAELGSLGIDLNFGCPAKTVNRHDGGASLLKSPSRVHDVTNAVRKATPLHRPVSVKVRLGFDHKNDHVEIAQAAESGGAAWITVHARTRDEGYRPPAHWEYIARMRESVSIPVIANGEVWSIEDYEAARKVSGCRHVMIGRGLMSWPDLARSIKDRNRKSADWSETKAWLENFGNLSRDFRHEHYAVCRVKQSLKSLTKRHPEAVTVFETAKRSETLSELYAHLGA